MAEFVFADLATVTVSSGGTTAPGGGSSESWTVAAGTGIMPTLLTGQVFDVVDPAQPTELMTVTATASGTSWTVTRGAYGTTPVVHTTGFTAREIVTAASLGKLASGALIPTNFLAPTGASYETFPRQFNNTGNSLTGTSGALTIAAIALPAGLTIGHIAFVSAATAAGTPTNWWFGLYDQNRVQLALTADQTTTAWAANTMKSLAIATVAAGAASTFTTTYSGLYYIGVMVKATTAPNLVTSIAPAGVQVAPVLSGQTDLTQTTPPAFPHTMASIFQVNNYPYGFVGP